MHWLTLLWGEHMILNIFFTPPLTDSKAPLKVWLITKNPESLFCQQENTPISVPHTPNCAPVICAMWQAGVLLP